VPQPLVKTDEKAEQLSRCTELQARKEWAGLIDCAKQLQKLGAGDKAGELQSKAAQEKQNANYDAAARSALRSLNLKDAQALLQRIGTESVYYQPLGDSFAQAETARADEARSKAQGFADLHDCVVLKRYLQNLSLSNAGTERVVAAAAAVKCMEKGAAQPPVAPTPRRASPGNNDGAPSGPARIVQPKTPSCDTMNIEDLMTQASNQYAAGFYRSGLKLVTTALGCKQDVRLYRTAAMYACAAHDAASAKTYFTEVPTQFQGAIIQRCQQEGIRLRD
jgi:hypothetical protein